MAWVVAVPSFDRLSSIRKQTLQLLLTAGISPKRIHVFADPEQFNDYQEVLKDLGVHVVRGQRGISNQRNAIMKHFEPGARVVEMDDDIRCLVVTTGCVRSERNAKTVMVPDEHLEQVVDHIWEVADRENCKLWGIYPTPNNFFLSRTYTLGLAKSTAQLQGYYNPGTMQLTLPVMEDYERILLFWSQGFSCIRCDYLSVRTFNKARGGCDSAFGEYGVEGDKEKILRHPREMAEAAAAKQLQLCYPQLIRQTISPKVRQKTVPVHGKVRYHPPGWRIMLKSHGSVRYISATDVCGSFAALLGLGADVKPVETVKNGVIIDLRRHEHPESPGTDEGLEGPDGPEFEEADDSEEDRAIDFMILMQLHEEDLRDLCHEAGLEDTGSRNELIERLMNVEDKPPKKRKREKGERKEKKDKDEKNKEKKEKRDKKEKKDKDKDGDKPGRREKDKAKEKFPEGKSMPSMKANESEDEEVKKDHKDPEVELQRLEAFFAAQEEEEASFQKAFQKAAQQQKEQAQEETQQQKGQQTCQEAQAEALAQAQAQAEQARALAQAQVQQRQEAQRLMMQAQAAREQQRLLEQQAEQILESCGRLPVPKPVVPPSPTVPALRVWQPGGLRHMVPRIRGQQPRSLHPWGGQKPEN